MSSPTPATARVDVVGLGPAGVDMVTQGTRELIKQSGSRFLRTRRHPSAYLLPDAQSFDHHYESADSFEEVYTRIVADLLAAARESHQVLYAVPGSPVVAERTVQMLIDAARNEDVDVVLHPAMSFLDLAWARLRVDPSELGVTLADGHDFSRTAPSDGGPVLVSQCESKLTMSDIKLSVDVEGECRVALLYHLGLHDERVTWMDWSEIDRGPDPDHLTSLWVPDLPPRVGGRLASLSTLVADLRLTDPWKAAQDHTSLQRFLIEEAYEVLEALDSYDPASGSGADELVSELGDLLYQVVFHSLLGEEAGWFELDDVVAAIHAKLSARSAVGVMEEIGSSDIETVVRQWELTKQDEMGRESAFDGIPRALPALLRAAKLLRKASSIGVTDGTSPLVEPGGTDLDPTGSGRELLEVVLRIVEEGDDPENLLRVRLDELESRLRSEELRQQRGR